MNNQQSRKIQRPWQDLVNNWDILASPGRPSVWEIKLYEQWAKPHLRKGANVLLLGSTPELRDMLAKHDCKVVVVDNNLSMIEGMVKYVKRKPKNEIWVKTDWLKAPLKEKYFDLVLGDFVLSNLPYTAHDQFLKRIKNWLKPNGSFITRIESFKDYYQTMSIAKLVKLCRNKPFDKKTINYFWNSGNWFTRPIKTKEAAIGEFWQKLQRYLAKNKEPKIRRLLEKSGFLFPLDKVWFTYMEKDLTKLLNKYFVLSNKKNDPKLNMYYPDYGEIYRLKHK